jgi:hypothetical protein
MNNSKAAVPPVPTKHFSAGKELAYVKWSKTAHILNNFGGTPGSILLENKALL